jgi:tetratricopeptide (TPR) repeat protein
VTDHPSPVELWALCRSGLPVAGERRRLRFGRPSPPVELTPEENAAYDAAIERAIRTARVHARKLDPHQAEVRKAVAILSQGGLEALEKLPRHMGDLARIEAFLEKSWSLRNDDPTLMAQFAYLAAHLARQLDIRRYGIQQVFDLQGRAWAELGNAYRVLDQLDLAATILDTAREMLEQGSGEESLHARLYELEASLAADRREFRKATNLLLEVQAFHQRKGDDHMVGRILILRGLYTGYAGAPERGIGLLQEGLSLVDEKRDPTLAYNAVHNQLLFIIDLGRISEARKFRLQNSRVLSFEAGLFNKIRLQALDGRIDAGMGKFDRAESLLRDARDRLAEVGRSYDSSLAALDLAAVLMAQGRMAEAEEVALTASAVFRRLRIHREGLATLTMLHSAFKMGRVTLDLLREVTVFFRRLQTDTNARFDGPLL